MQIFTKLRRISIWSTVTEEDISELLHPSDVSTGMTNPVSSQTTSFIRFLESVIMKSQGRMELSPATQHSDLFFPSILSPGKWNFFSRWFWLLWESTSFPSQIFASYLVPLGKLWLLRIQENKHLFTASSLHWCQGEYADIWALQGLLVFWERQTHMQKSWCLATVNFRIIKIQTIAT